MKSKQNEIQAEWDRREAEGKPPEFSPPPEGLSEGERQLWEWERRQMGE